MAARARILFIISSIMLSQQGTISAISETVGDVEFLGGVADFQCLGHQCTTVSSSAGVDCEAGTGAGDQVGTGADRSELCSDVDSDDSVAIDVIEVLADREESLYQLFESVDNEHSANVQDASKGLQKLNKWIHAFKIKFNVLEEENRKLKQRIADLECMG